MTGAQMFVFRTRRSGTDGVDATKGERVTEQDKDSEAIDFQSILTAFRLIIFRRCLSVDESEASPSLPLKEEPFRPPTRPTMSPGEAHRRWSVILQGWEEVLR